MNVRSIIDDMLAIIDELSQFEDDEPVEIVEDTEGKYIYLVGDAIQEYKNSLN